MAGTTEIEPENGGLASRVVSLVFLLVWQTEKVALEKISIILQEI